jgi:hypothetical protein
MMSVRPQYRRSNINTFMVDAIKRNYPNAKVEFSAPTEMGQSFIKSYLKS